MDISKVNNDEKSSEVTGIIDPTTEIAKLSEDINHSEDFTVDPILFDKEFRSLYKQLEETLIESDAGHITLNRNNPILVSLRRYMKVYDVTDPAEHIPYFLKIFTQGSSYIPYPEKIDTWLSGGVKIQYGEGIKKVEARKIGIYLGAIYRTARNLEKQDRDRLESYSSSAEDYAKCYSLIRCDAIKLHLVRLFAAIVPEKRKELNVLINLLEDELGITVGQNVNTEVNPVPVIGNVVDSLAKTFLKGGNNDNSLASMGDLGNVIGEMMGNEKVKETISSVVNGIKNCNNLQDIIGLMTKQLGSTELRDAVHQVLPEMQIPPLGNECKLDEDIESTPSSIVIDIEAPPVENILLSSDNSLDNSLDNSS